MVKPVRKRTDPRDIDWPAKIRLAQRNDWTLRELADHCGVTYETAWRHAKRLGYKRRKSPAWHSTVGRRIYSAWQTMRTRCRSSSHPAYEHFGGRGVRICERWERFEAFHDWARRNGYQPGMGLVLKPGSRLFSPANCTWANAWDIRRTTMKRRPPPRRGLVVEIFGERKTLTEWARDRRCRVSEVSLARRLRQGIRPEEALANPPRRRWDPPLPRGRRPALPPAAPKRVDRSRLVRMYEEHGASPDEIAAEIGATKHHVVSVLKKRFGPEGLSKPPMTPARHRLYGLWRSLWERTTDRRHPLYGANGGRGVRVCRAWTDFEAFCRWAVSAGTRPHFCLVRVRADRPFSPGNCVWVSRSEQRRRAEARKRAERPRRRKRGQRRARHA